MHHTDIIDSIGDTPLVELKQCSPKPGVRLFAKLEGTNPTGSVKDRIVKEMVLEAEQEGLLKPGGTIVEASTGNTGIALAMVGRSRGYNVRVVMPENVYPEIPRTLAAYSAVVDQIPAENGVRGAMEVAREMASREGWLMMDQFCNPSNTKAHYETTGPEILADLPQVDVFLAGLGTGGTLMGVGRRLKEANPRTQVIAVEPHPGYQVQGLKSLADGFIPPILDFNLLDGRILVRSAHAFRAAAEIMKREAIFAGVSSGAVLHAAEKVAARLDRGNVVLLFADSGWKYLATNLWNQDTAEGGDGEELDDVIWW
ncbi:MAG TPA: cysteine synthase family protein [Dehalococcoidia bacterium]|nr:cysteine synthase family protein [Dehalococcoidia bacterium]